MLPEKEDLLKVAAREWRDGKMSGEMFAHIAYGFLFPVEVCGMDALLRYKKTERGD